jgi:hypothetical protein
MGSFSIVWDDCDIVGAYLSDDHQGVVSLDSSQGVTMHCIRVGTNVTCDFLDETTGKYKDQPAVFVVELETADHIFLSNESNSTRLHLNTGNSRAILKSNVFFLSNPSSE